MSKKLTFNYVKNFIENEGYKLLSTEYINAHEKLTVKCDKKHIYNVKFNKFQQGQRCPFCNGGIKLTYEHVKSFIEKEGYILLSTEYLNAHEKLLIQCNKGHIFKMSFNTFKQGTRCHTCFNDDRRLTFNYVKDFIEKENYILLSTEYVNVQTPILIQCDQRHVPYYTRFYNFQQGKRCPICYKERTTTKLNIEDYYYYRHQVDNLTEKTYRKYKQIINPMSLPRGKKKYNLDHKYSVYDGFINGIQPEIIASINNLQILPEYENISKHKNSCITLQELLGD